jgi:3-deoxy-manno-octulosonate cytidylyltransferase (CMP-KDO synthetase)
MPPAAARYAVLIPARYASTRLPGKVLLRESGKYLVQHVHERALAAAGSPRVIVLTDDDRVEAAVRSFGGEAMRTRADHASGTDRCAEAARRIEEPVVVNLQGDEPLIDPSDLARLAEAAAGRGVDVATLGHPFARREDEADPHSVKALRGRDGFAVDFRRASPSDAERRGVDVLHHLGVYAFRRARLLDFAAMPPSPRERAERLEQLRALESGWRIRVLDAAGPGSGVDTREDYDEFLRALRAGTPRRKPG